MNEPIAGQPFSDDIFDDCIEECREIEGDMTDWEFFIDLDKEHPEE